MTIFFDTDIAKDVGMTAAVVYDYIIEGVTHNMAHKQCVYDGLYWVRESVAEMQLTLSFLSTKQITAALSTLISDGYLEGGCFNDDPRDRTRWYTNGRKGRNYDFSSK